MVMWCSSQCGCHDNCKILGPLSLTDGVVEDNFTTEAGSASITGDGLAINSNSILLCTTSAPGTSPEWFFKLNGHVALTASDIFRIYVHWTDSSNNFYIEIKVGTGAYFRLYRVVGGVTDLQDEYYQFVQPAGSFDFCVSFTDEDGGRLTMTVDGRGFFGFPNVFTPTFGVGTGAVSTPILLTEFSVSKIDEEHGCHSCSLPTCPGSIDQFLGSPTGHSLTAQFDATFDVTTDCEECTSIGGSQTYQLDRSGSYYIPAACGFSAVGSFLSVISAYYQFCELVCTNESGDVAFGTGAILGTLTGSNGQCHVWATAEIWQSKSTGGGFGMYGQDTIATPNAPGLPDGIQTVELLSIDEFNRRKDAAEPIFKIPFNCSDGAMICGSAFPTEYRIFNNSTGENTSNCNSFDELFWLMQQCCTGLVEDPVSGQIEPAAPFILSRVDNPSLDVDKVYRIQIEDSGDYICASVFGLVTFPTGRMATLAAGPYDACTDCLPGCSLCESNYFDNFTFHWPVIDNDQFSGGPSSCAGIYTAYSARFAGNLATIYSDASSECGSRNHPLSYFYFTPDGPPSNACPTGDDGQLIVAGIVFMDNGDGTITLNFSIELDASGGVFALIQYSATVTGLVNCLTGSYTFHASANPFGGATAPDVIVNLNGYTCSGEMMSRPPLESSVAKSATTSPIKSNVTSSSTKITSGVGTQLKKKFEVLGIKIDCGSCRALLQDMNKWGPSGCKERLDAILTRIQQNKKTANLKWSTIIKAGGIALREGLPLSIRGLVEQSILEQEEIESSL